MAESGLSRLVSIALILIVIGTFSVLALGVLKGSVVIEFPRGSPLVLEEQTANATVFLAKDSFRALSLLFQSRQDEWVVCLQGDATKEGYFVRGLSSTKIVESTQDRVVFEACPSSSLGTVHNHPSGSCRMSLADAFNFGESSNKIIGIICGAESLSFWDRRDVEAPLKLRIQ